MTREELKAHCERQIQRFELVEKIMPVTPNDWKRYEEHKLILELLEQESSVLDKVRAEILDEAEYAYADFDQYKEDILYAEPDELPDDDFRYGMERAVAIIDKYKNGGAKLSGGGE